MTALVAFALRNPEGDDDLAGRRVSATPDVSPYRGGVKVEGETVEEARRRSHEQLMVAGAKDGAAIPANISFTEGEAQ